MVMGMFAIIIALVLMVIAFKVLTGIIKIGAIIAIALIAAYFVLPGMM